MKKYVSPKAEFVKIGNTDILTASFGFDLPAVEFNKDLAVQSDSGKASAYKNSLNDERLDSDNGIVDKAQ